MYGRADKSFEESSLTSVTQGNRPLCIVVKGASETVVSTVPLNTIIQATQIPTVSMFCDTGCQDTKIDDCRRGATAQEIVHNIDKSSTGRLA